VYYESSALVPAFATLEPMNS